MIEKKAVANKQQIITEYLSGANTFNVLELKYGIKARTIQTWVRAFRIDHPAQTIISKEPDDVRILKKHLEEALLKNELLEEILRLSEEQTGLDLRKKAGTRRS
jgi:transposase-like protein